MQYVSTALSLCLVSRHAAVFEWKTHCTFCGSASSTKHSFYRKTTDSLFSSNGNATHISEHQFEVRFDPENAVTQGKREQCEEVECAGFQDFKVSRAVRAAYLTASQPDFLY